MKDAFDMVERSYNHESHFIVYFKIIAKTKINNIKIIDCPHKKKRNVNV